MSSCSLASTSSSSGSSLGAKPKFTQINGSVTMKTNTNAILINSKIGNGVNLITKSISFDKTAERGDREVFDDDNKNKKGFFKNIKISFKNRRGKWYRNEELR